MYVAEVRLDYIFLLLAIWGRCQKWKRRVQRHSVQTIYVQMDRGVDCGKHE